MKRYAVVVSVLLVALAGDPGQAGVFDDVWRALDLAATPSGFPIFTTGDGTRVNGGRSGRLRIVPSGLGPGYELQFDRTFGGDSRGRPEVMNFGGLGDLFLSGGTQMTLGYSGDDFRSVHGSIAVNNLAYELRSTIGAQDASLSGRFDFLTIFDLNQLGFYDVTLNAVNSEAELKLEGLAVDDVEDTNFNIGPINISGNIFFDGALALLAGLGVDTTELEGIFPESPIDQINNAIEDQLQEWSVVAGEALAADAALGQPGQSRPAPIIADQLLPPPTGGDQGGDPVHVPEPGTLLLVAFGGSTLWYWQRRR